MGTSSKGTAMAALIRCFSPSDRTNCQPGKIVGLGGGTGFAGTRAGTDGLVCGAPETGMTWSAATIFCFSVKIRWSSASASSPPLTFIESSSKAENALSIYRLADAINFPSAS